MASLKDQQELAMLDEMVGQQRQENQNLMSKFINCEKEMLKLCQEVDISKGNAIIFEETMIKLTKEFMKNLVTQYNSVAAHWNETSPITDETIPVINAKIAEVKKATEAILLDIEFSEKKIENDKLELKELETPKETEAQESLMPLMLNLKKLKYSLDTENSKYQQNLGKLKEQTMIFETYKEELKEKQDEHKQLEVDLLNMTISSKNVKDKEERFIENGTTLEAVVSNVIKSVEKICGDENLYSVLNKIITLQNDMEHDHSENYGAIAIKQNMDERDRCVHVNDKLIGEINDMEIKCNRKIYEIDNLKIFCVKNSIKFNNDFNEESPKSGRTHN